MSEKLIFYQVDPDGVQHEVDMEATDLILKPYVIDSDGNHDRLLMGNDIEKLRKSIHAKEHKTDER